jgi:hypothetical protein
MLFHNKAGEAKTLTSVVSCVTLLFSVLILDCTSETPAFALSTAVFSSAHHMQVEEFDTVSNEQPQMHR